MSLGDHGDMTALEGPIVGAAARPLLRRMQRTPAPDRRLLAAKLQPPAANDCQVQRKEVVDAVCNAPSAKLILLRAPAGFGKTTAMAQCREALEAAGTATAWLTLDRADNDASRLFAGLAAATADLLDEAFDPTLPAHAAGLDWIDMALDMMSRLSGLTRAFAIFLDELDVIQEPGIYSLLREIIQRLPQRGKLVVASRSLPDLLLGRLRGRGHLLEIDPSQLRFSLQEAEAFITQRQGIELEPGDLDRLHRKTEGWIVALWLASMALKRSHARGGFIERFSGTERSISDYLAEEVLARQPAAVRDFLLRTSILRHLEPSLCKVVAPQVDCERVLRDLVATDVLVVANADERDTYRYHSLFAGFLRSQLERDMPGEAARLHVLLSAWYEAQGRPVPAIDHAVDGGHAAHAVTLLSRHAMPLLTQGRLRLLSRWFGALPDAALHAHPVLQMVRVWATCFTRGPWEAMDLLNRSGLDESADAQVGAHLRALKPTLLAMMDQYEEAYAIGRAGLAALPSAVPFADNLLSNTMATIVTVVGERGEARRLIDAARQTQAAGASEFNEMFSEASDGVLDLHDGRLKLSMARFRMAVTSHRSSDRQHTGGNAFAGVPYAALVYESDDMPLAAELLQVYLPMARDIGLPDHIILGYRTQARIAFARGEVDQAWQALAELEYVGQRRQQPRVVASAKLERARLLLLQGYDRASLDELERADDRAIWSRVERLRFMANDVDDMMIGRLRWEAHFGNAGAAALAIEAARRLAEQGRRQQRALKLSLLKAIALDRAGERSAAIEWLAGVLRLAAIEGFVRIFVDEGERLGAPLRELETTLLREERSNGDPLFLQYVHQLAHHFTPLSGSAEEPRDTDVLLDPLTRKEINVLQLAAEGYSNPALADRLCLSDSTVRTHLRNINSKLNTRNRTQAVAVARRLGQIR